MQRGHAIEMAVVETKLNVANSNNSELKHETTQKEMRRQQKLVVKRRKSTEKVTVVQTKHKNKKKVYDAAKLETQSQQRNGHCQTQKWSTKWKSRKIGNKVHFTDDRGQQQ